jgi:hypothetical protein
MKSLRGIIHVHSTFSYDGKHSLEEIAEMARKRGHDFVGITEHSNTLDDDKMAAMVEECRRVSSPQCLIIPGVEFTCENNLHLVSVGVERYTAEKRPGEVARFVQEQGGVAVVAHPVRYQYRIPTEMLPHLDGIEIWNAGYDGRFIPNDRSIRLVADLRRTTPSLFAFAGQDLHRIQNYRHVSLTLQCADFTRQGIIQALKAGDFCMENRYFRLDARHLPSGWRLWGIGRIRRLYESMRAYKSKFSS